MAEKQHGRRAASTPVKTPLTELTQALHINKSVAGRSAAVVAAAGGLVASIALPAAAATKSDDVVVSAAQPEEKPDKPEFVNQAATVVDSESDTEAVALPGSNSMKAVTAEKAPEPEPEPVQTVSNDSQSSSNSSRSSSNSSGASSASSESDSSAGSVSLPNGSKAQQVIALAKQYVGTPYVYGGTSPSGWDCSGFTSYIYSKVGVDLPRTANAQAAAGRRVSASEARPGDLVWHNNHIGIYAGNGMMYDAGSSRSDTSYRSHSWMGAVSYIRVL